MCGKLKRKRKELFLNNEVGKIMKEFAALTTLADKMKINNLKLGSKVLK